MAFIIGTVRRESKGETDDLKNGCSQKSSSPGSDRVQKGAVNVAEGWKGGLQEPSGLNARENACVRDG